MKLREKHSIIKKFNFDYIIFLKSGNFYVTFDNDALIINHIFSYQITDGHVGFPIRSLEKVVKELDNNIINYIIYNSDDEELIDKEFDNNTYYSHLELAKRDEFNNNMNNLLLDRIKNILETKSDSYEKIRRFIDEL